MPTEAPPQERAREEPGERHEEVVKRSLAFADEVVEEGRRIDAHKGQQGTKVQQLHTALNDGDEVALLPPVSGGAAR